MGVGTMNKHPYCDIFFTLYSIILLFYMTLGIESAAYARNLFRARYTSRDAKRGIL